MLSTRAGLVHFKIDCNIWCMFPRTAMGLARFLARQTLVALQQSQQLSCCTASQCTISCPRCIRCTSSQAQTMASVAILRSRDGVDCQFDRHEAVRLLHSDSSVRSQGLPSHLVLRMQRTDSSIVRPGIETHRYGRHQPDLVRARRFPHLTGSRLVRAQQ